MKPNPLEVLRGSQPAANEEYRLGRGDEITVDFSGRPEMQAKLVIGPDGRVTIPLAGEIVVADLTRSEAAKAIETALSEYYSNMGVMVTVTKYTSNRVIMLGAVEHPGVLSFDGQPTLLEALTRAGLETGTNKTGKIPECCAIYRGRDQVFWVELKQLIESGNTLADLRLRRDDVVFVPTAAYGFVSVLGEVGRPGAVQLTSASSVASVIAEAGGFTAKAGSDPHVQIVDPSKGNTRTVVRLSEMLKSPKSLEATLKAGDIVYVPQSGFNKVTYTLERLNPLTSLMVMTAATGTLGTL